MEEAIDTSFMSKKNIILKAYNREKKENKLTKTKLELV